MNIKEKLYGFISYELLESKADEELSEDTQLFSQGLLDSMDLLDLMTYIEDQFSVKIRQDEIIPENIDTIQLLFDFITEKIRKR